MHRWNVNCMQEYQLPPGSDPHFVSLSPDERMAYVSAYFLEEGDEGLVHMKGEALQAAAPLA
jgi:hypothetical protein